MPTVLIKNGFRFFFYSNDLSPMHIHVEYENKTAKFNLEPLQLIRSNKFNVRDIRKMHTLIEENLELFKAKWNEYFNN